jgi:hypothetical protein
MTTLQGQLINHPNELAQSEIGMLLTNLIEPTLAGGWQPSYYRNALRKLSKSGELTDSMKALTAHAASIQKMMYTGNYHHTSNLIYDILGQMHKSENSKLKP